MYSGGLWGEGFGRGSPEYTPIAQSDFIYAVIGEELGFVGCLILLLFFLILLGRGFAVAARTASSFGRLLALGITTIAASQIFLNVAGVTKLVPLTGIPLPFISHGGSSLMTTFMSLGLLLAISDGAVRNRQGEDDRRRGRILTPARAPESPARTEFPDPQYPSRTVRCKASHIRS
jgi:cell division protein FtsW (lipid II flippase)